MRRSGTVGSASVLPIRVASAGSNSPGGAGGVPPPAGAPGLMIRPTLTGPFRLAPVIWATNFCELVPGARFATSISSIGFTKNAAAAGDVRNVVEASEAPVGAVPDASAKKILTEIGEGDRPAAVPLSNATFQSPPEVLLEKETDPCANAEALTSTAASVTSSFFMVFCFPDLILNY